MEIENSEKIRINPGILKLLSELSGVGVQYLSDICATRKRPGRKTALIISDAANELGVDIPPEILIFGGEDEIKKLVNQLK